MGMSTFQLSFLQEAHLKNFNYVEAEKISFKKNVFDFSVDGFTIGKSDILNIQKYLMVKINV